jgi:ankyrin repeat protein
VVAQDQYQSTSLHQACVNGHLDLARFLVERGADAYAQDQYGWTPLNLASFNGHFDLERFLIEYNANVTAQFTPRVHQSTTT